MASTGKAWGLDLRGRLGLRRIPCEEWAGRVG